MKILFSAIISLVIPLFFVFVLGSGLHSKLTQLRNRCRLTCERAESAADDVSATEPDKETVLKECSQASRDHDAARFAYLARVVSALFGFRESASPRIGTHRGE